jgi:hypothetical protein
VACAVVAIAACGVGPVRVGLMPRMAPIGQSRDPDPTRNPTEQGMQAASGGEGASSKAGADPLAKGPLSGGLTLTSFALWALVGVSPLLGAYGTFDETGLIVQPPAPSSGDQGSATER